jgi:hypothetical protein
MLRFTSNRTETPKQVFDRMNRHPQRSALARELKREIVLLTSDMYIRGFSKEDITRAVEELVILYGAGF